MQWANGSVVTIGGSQSGLEFESDASRFRERAMWRSMLLGFGQGPYFGFISSSRPGVIVISW
jgi:hypothetical protein